MKNDCIKILVAAIATSCAALPLAAQEMSHAQGSPQKAAEIIGMDVMDSQNHRSGTVRDFVVDLQDGRVAEVIIGTGDRVGLEEKATAVPSSCLTFNTTDKSVRLNVTREELQNAPPFSMSNWKEADRSAKIAQVYLLYGVPLPAFANLERATTLIGKAVKNNQDKKLGRVSTIVVDMPAGRVDEVILASGGGFLGLHSELTAVPPQSFVYDPDGAKLRLDVTRESLKNAPHFKANEWRASLVNITEPTASAPVAANPVVEPRTNPVALSKPGEMQIQATTPAKSDEEITTEIREKIMLAAGITDDAREAQIITKNGKVTLQGMVQTEFDKEKLGEIASSVVPPENVDNKLIVTIGTVTTTGGEKP